MKTGRSSAPPPYPIAREGDTVHLFVRDLVVSADIGVHPHEYGRRQAIRINLDLAVDDWRPRGATTVPQALDDVVDYEKLVDTARRLADRQHWPLVETLAERLAEEALADPRVRQVHVRVEKLDVFADAGAVGVEIARGQTAVTPGA